METWINLDLARQIVDIARAASVEILKIYHSQTFDIQLKSDNSPVTAADLAANAVITEGLQKLSPRLPIISEETAEIPFSERTTFDYFWLVDPLDGTKEFIKRNGEFTVNIALIHRTQAILGVVFVPITEGCYFAVKGFGSFQLVKNFEANGWNVLKTDTENAAQNDNFKTICCDKFHLTDTHLRIPVSRSHLSEATKTWLEQFDDPILTPKGSALKLAMLAAGEFDLYPRIGLTGEWDTAAAQIIIEEAGGSLVDFDSRKPLVYNKKSLLNPDFIAFGQVLSE